VLLYCHAGCSFQSISHALGLRDRLPTGHEQRITERRPTVLPDMMPTWLEFKDKNPDNEPRQHERLLGIPVGGLARLGVVWSSTLNVLACPMMNRPCGQIIGIRLRADSGRKWAIPGSRNGLFCPVSFVGEGSLYMPEGMTDTAALLGLGLDAVGRPSCSGGRDLCRSMASARPIVVVADADEPGRVGAEMLARELAADGRNVRVLPPPPGIKDAREWVSRGGTRSSVEFAARSRRRV